MSDNSRIEWTDATPLRVRATAATRIGVSLAEYDVRRSADQKWCTGCKAWHGVEAFAVDRSRGDGHAKWCRAYNNSQARAQYVPRQRPAAGRRFVEARSGDAEQARRRVNHLVDTGILPRPNSLPCTDCGHICAPGERRHEYDHFRGYDAAHHEDVEAVCTTCHHAREDLRRAA